MSGPDPNEDFDAVLDECEKRRKKSELRYRPPRKEVGEMSPPFPIPPNCPYFLEFCGVIGFRLGGTDDDPSFFTTLDGELAYGEEWRPVIAAVAAVAWEKETRNTSDDEEWRTARRNMRLCRKWGESK